MTQQGSSPPRSSRLPATGRHHGQGGAPPRRGTRPPSGYSWDTDTDTDDEAPPWAGIQVAPRQAGKDRPAGAHEADAGGPGASRGARSRLAAARARRARLKLYIWGAAVAVAVIITAVTVLEVNSSPNTRPIADGVVTTFQRGEFQSVPSACRSVAAATLAQYLPGKPAIVVPQSLYGRAQSMCDWTVDQPTVYRHLGVTVQAYAPSELASGDGSATEAAADAYAQAEKDKASPPRATHLPKAAMSQLAGVGNSAFTAAQVVKTGGDTTDIMTVVVREHNVLITAQLEGVGGRVRGRHYSQVSMAELTAGAEAVARDLASQFK
ncbi:MAG TPA: hypothetical protein VGS19_09990 [Streptosporangiaceae bacterium]|nr:hypothetical protein [Streptosporangiaceae bacterium]